MNLLLDRGPKLALLIATEDGQTPNADIYGTMPVGKQVQLHGNDYLTVKGYHADRQIGNSPAMRVRVR